MTHKLEGATAGPRWRLKGTTFGLVLCIALTATPASAQELTFLVKDQKTPIAQLFYPEKNETVINAPIAITADMSNRLIVMVSGAPPLGEKLTLWSASYTFAGRTPARPQGVTFIFYTERKKKDRFKENRAFSVSADGAVLQQGDDLKVEEQTYKVGGKPFTWHMLSVTVPTDAFLTLARARKAEFKLGPETFKLSGDQRKHLLALAGTIEK